MNRGLSLSNTNDIIANSIHLIQGNVITDILDLINANSVDTNVIITALLADQTFIDALAASANNSYTKNESDNLYYTKTYLNTALTGKVDVNTLNSYYLKTEIDTNNYTKTQTNNLLLNKQNTIGVNDLSISNINLLQTSLNNLDSRILNNYNSINNIYTKTEIDNNIYIKTEIDNNIYIKTEIDTNIYTKTQTDTLITTKQNIINNGDLTIAKTSGLQSALDLKRNISESYSKTEPLPPFLLSQPK
jgi:hypothetical protein